VGEVMGKIIPAISAPPAPPAPVDLRGMSRQRLRDHLFHFEYRQIGLGTHSGHKYELPRRILRAIARDVAKKVIRDARERGSR